MRVKILAVLIISILIKSLSVFSQNIEIFGGISKNTFYDRIGNDAFSKTSYSSEYGYGFGVGIEDVKVDHLKLMFTLHLDKYSGNINFYEGSMGGGNSINAATKKFSLAFGFYPINIQIFHQININLGLEISKLVFEKYNGDVSGWLYGQSSWSYDLQQKFDHFGRSITFGPKGRISYDIHLSKTITMTPQYIFYYGLSKEFDQVPFDIKSIRHYFCVGVKKELR